MTITSYRDLFRSVPAIKCLCYQRIALTDASPDSHGLQVYTRNQNLFRSLVP